MTQLLNELITPLAVKLMRGRESRKGAKARFQRDSFKVANLQINAHF
jgi:hypothetical protein